MACLLAAECGWWTDGRIDGAEQSDASPTGRYASVAQVGSMPQQAGNRATTTRFEIHSCAYILHVVPKVKAEFDNNNSEHDLFGDQGYDMKVFVSCV